MEWILYSNVIARYLSGKDSGSNPSGMTHLCSLEVFEAESFSLKYNHTSYEYEIHSVEVDLYYFKNL